MSAGGDPQEVVVVTFPGEGKADEVLRVLRELEHQHAIALRNAAVVVRNAQGHVHIKETRDFNAKQGAVAGALAGGLIGLMHGKMLQDALIGAAGGALAAGVVDLGFPDAYLREVAESLTPGSSAIVAVVHFEHAEQAMQVLDQFDGGKILRHTLAPEIAQQLAAVVED